MLDSVHELSLSMAQEGYEDGDGGEEGDEEDEEVKATATQSRIVDGSENFVQTDAWNSTRSCPLIKKRCWRFIGCLLVFGLMMFPSEIVWSSISWKWESASLHSPIYIARVL